MSLIPGKGNLISLNFVFSTNSHRTQLNFFVKWKREACPTTPSMKSGHRSKLKVVLALYSQRQAAMREV